MQNLVPVPDALGQGEKAQSLRQRVAAIQPTPPYRYFRLAMAGAIANQVPA